MDIFQTSRPPWRRFVRQKVIWLPTGLGWLVLFVLLIAPVLIWAWVGEQVLGSTKRIGADVLVVEGWIGAEGAREAAGEFNRHRYRYVVATGGLTGEPWNEKRWSHTDAAAHALLLAGVPRDALLLAYSGDSIRHRTRAAAISAKEVLLARGVQPRAVHVFTRTVHARRSELVFSRVFRDTCPVGRIAWSPPGFSDDPQWWHYSSRAEDLLKETVGLVVEWFEGLRLRG